MTAIGDCKSKSSLYFSNIDMNIIKIVFSFILDPLTYIFNLIICDSTMKIIAYKFLHFIEKYYLSMSNNMILLEILQLRTHSMIVFCI